MFLLDTDVISQTPKARPDQRVMTWLRSVPESRLRISAITIQEVRFGVELLAPGDKRNAINAWLEQDLLKGFTERILPIDAPVAEACGHLLAEQKRRRYTPDPNDALIAATALVHGRCCHSQSSSF